MAAAYNNLPDHEQVQKDIEKLEEINKNQEERVRILETKALQVANLFFVFQGVILTSTSSSSNTIGCHHWWIPFCLSLLASILNIVFFWGIAKTFLATSEELDQNHEDCQVMRAYLVTKAQVNEADPGNRIPRLESRASSSHNGSNTIRTKPDSLQMQQRRFFAYLGVALLIGFSGVMLYGCQAILCRDHQ